MRGREGCEFQTHDNQARSSMSVLDPVPTEDTQHWNVQVQSSDPRAVYVGEATT